MKANTTQQEKYNGSVVPMNEIQTNSQSLLPQQSKVTEAQAELVHANRLMLD